MKNYFFLQYTSFLIFPLSFLWFTASVTEESKKGRIIINVENIKHGKGNICVLLFDKAEGYPKDLDKAIVKEIKPVDGRKFVSFELPPLKYGKYAVAVLHDENNNNKMDYNVFGIPKEGFGFFKISGSILKLPSFEETSILLQSEKLEEKVSLIY